MALLTQRAEAEASISYSNRDAMQLEKTEENGKEEEGKKSGK